MKMNLFNPLLTEQQKFEYRKYENINNTLKPYCIWVDFYDYIWGYNNINWKNKTVLDIGAEIGSSALFFLLNGAKFVYMLEKEEEYKKTHVKIKSLYTILENSVMLNNINEMPDKIDVLKMDCEGCELYYLNEQLLNKTSEFIIGLHKPPLDNYQFEEKKNLLEKYGGKYFGNVNNEEFLWVKCKKIAGDNEDV
jgi:predicted rRNA methylase YqxC with S4 and FtsJ domains